MSLVDIGTLLHRSEKEMSEENYFLVPLIVKKLFQTLLMEHVSPVDSDEREIVNITNPNFWYICCFTARNFCWSKLHIGSELMSCPRISHIFIFHFIDGTAICLWQSLCCCNLGPRTARNCTQAWFYQNFFYPGCPFQRLRISWEIKKIQQVSPV